MNPFKRNKKIHPKSILAMAALTCLLVTACNTKEEAVKKNSKPKTSAYLVKQASILSAQDKYEEALQMYLKVTKRPSISRTPALHAESLAQASRLLVMQGKVEEASQLTDKCLEVWNSPMLVGDEKAEVLVSIEDLGQAYLEKAKGKNETLCLEQAAKLLGEPFNYKNKHYFKALIRLSSAYILEGSEAKANKYKKLVLEADYTGAKDMIYIAAAYRIKGKDKQAKELFDRAQSISTRGRRRVNKIFFELAVAKKYIYIGENEKAKTVLKNILKRTDTSYKTEDLSNTYEELAYISEKEGNIEEATEYFKKSLKEQKLRGRRQKILRRRLEAFYRFAHRNNLEALANEVNLRIKQIREADPEAKKHLY